jgi:predicted dehydrogenase
MFRWGVLSTAKIGREQVVPAILESRNGIVSAIASRKIAKAKDFAERFQVPHAFGSYQAMLDSDVIDGVYIPLITSEHVEWTIKAAMAGKHVLIEKPLSLNAGELKPVLAAAKKSGVLVSEAFMVTYHPQWLKVRELVQGGAIGKLRHVQGAFSYNNTGDWSNMRNRADQGGGAIPDIGVYPTVTTRFVTGMEPKKVSATVEYERGVDVYSSIRQHYGSFELSFYLSMRLANRQFMVFHGDKGFVEVHEPFNARIYGDPVVTLSNGRHDEITAWRFAGANQYKLMVEAFADAAKPGGDRSTVFSLADSVANQKPLDAILRAGKRADGGWETV